MPKIELKTLDEAIIYAESLESKITALENSLAQAKEEAKKATEANNKNFRALLSQTKTVQAPGAKADPFDKFKF